MMLRSARQAKNRIAVVPMNTVVNENGKATFIVIAKNKTVSARVFFKIGGVSVSIPVKIIK